MSCLICNIDLDGKKLSNHIKSDHGLNSEEYTIKFLYNNIKPLCKNCSNQTRYVAFSFKEYCTDCSKIAMKEGGKKGGKAEAWNKGKTKENDERLLKQSEMMSGEGNPFFNKKHNEETKNRISLKKRLGDTDLINRCIERNIDFELLTPLNEYFSRQQQYLEFKCKKCNQVSKKTLQAFERGSRCYFCEPIGTSNDELEILNWLKEMNLNLVHKDRTVISPKEIDILIGKVGIEYNGLYWHSDEIKENEVDDFNKGHMLNKTKMCLEKGVSLIHIYSDEWKYKKEICKSIILNKLKLNKEKIHARKCNIKEIDNDTFNEFMDNNHISGSVRSSIRLGLFLNEKLVCAIGLRKPLQKKWSNYIEISRFASLINSNVAGGLSKLLNYIRKELKINSIMTYADRRFGQGNCYEKCGFKLEGDTGLDYWYTDCDIRIDRSKIQSTKEKTEKEIAEEMKLLKIWGCGSNVYVIT